MKVLFLSVSGGLGGAERALLDAVVAVRACQPSWKTGVLGFEDGPLADQLAALGTGFDVVPLPRRFARLGESGGSALTTAAGLAASAPQIAAYTGRLRAAIDRHGPDVVHSNGFKSHVLGAWTVAWPRRLVWHMHDFVGHRRVSAWLLRRYAPGVAAVVANSHSVADDVRDRLGPGARVEVVHNGIDTSRFTPAGPVADLDALAGLPRAAAGTVRIGLVATYARWKGHEVFLQAVARLPREHPVRAYVIGGPQYQTAGSQRTREEIEGLVSALGLGDRAGLVEFQRDTAPIYRALDVVAHTSTAPEPFGLSIVEAMACGRATVISDAGGASEIARECPAAPVCRPGDPAELAAALERLVLDAGLRAEVGRAGRETAVRSFSRERMGAALVALYESIDSRRPLASAS